MYETTVIRPAADIGFGAEERTTTQVFQMIFMLGLLVIVAVLRGVI